MRKGREERGRKGGGEIAPPFLILVSVLDYYVCFAPELRICLLLIDVYHEHVCVIYIDLLVSGCFWSRPEIVPTLRTTWC